MSCPIMVTVVSLITGVFTIFTIYLARKDAVAWGREFDKTRDDYRESMRLYYRLLIQFETLEKQNAFMREICARNGLILSETENGNRDGNNEGETMEKCERCAHKKRSRYLEPCHSCMSRIRIQCSAGAIARVVTIDGMTRYVCGQHFEAYTIAGITESEIDKQWNGLIRCEGDLKP